MQASPLLFRVDPILGFLAAFVAPASAATLCATARIPVLREAPASLAPAILVDACARGGRSAGVAEFSRQAVEHCGFHGPEIEGSSDLDMRRSGPIGE